MAQSVTSFSPESGVPGQTVRIHGIGFDSVATNNSVTFGGVSAPVDSAKKTVLYARVPSGIEGTVDLRVSSGSTAVTATEQFSVLTGGGKSLSDIGAGLSGFASGSDAAEWGDYNGDGKPDLALVGEGSSGPASAIYRNEGNGGFTDIGAGLPGGDAGALDWGDYDADGDLDLALIGRSSSGRVSKVFRNDGGGTFVDIGANLTVAQEGAVEWGDYDDDGDLDLVITGRASTGDPPNTAIYRNEGDTDNDGNAEFSEISASVADVYGGGAEWGDYNDDGKLDLVLSGLDSSSTSKTIIYRNGGSGKFTSIGAGLTGAGSGSTVDWGDYNDDGKLDLVVSFGSETTIYRNDGQGTFAVETDLSGGSFGVASWGDYDADADLDLLVTGRTGTGLLATLYQNEGSGTFVADSMGLTEVGVSSVDWADYNSDGTLDLVVAGETSVNGAAETWIYKNAAQSDSNLPSIRPVADTLQTAGNTFRVKVTVGTDSLPVDSLFGTSFTLDYDSSQVSVVGDQAGPFLGSDVVYQSDVDASAGEIDIGVSRKRGDGTVSGHGVVARIEFQIDEDVPVGTQLPLQIKKVVSNDAEGDSVPLASKDLTVKTVEAPPIAPTGLSKVVAGNVHRVDIKVGTDSLPVDSLFGTSFTLGYDSSQVSVVNDRAGPFLGSDVVYQSDEDASAGEFDFGISRKRGDGTVSGQGIVARVWIRVDEDVPVGTQLPLEIKEVASNDAEGDAVRLAPKDLTVKAVEAPPIAPTRSPEVAAGNVHRVDIKVGTDSLPVDSLFGTSFTLGYDSSQLSVVDNQSGPFLGSDVVYQSDADTSAGEIDIGVSRKRGDGTVSGQGIVARVWIRIDEDVPVGTQLPLEITEVASNDEDGDPVLLAPKDLTVEVIEVPPIRPTGPSVVRPDSTFWVDISVGTDSLPVDSLFGTSFTLGYDSSQLSVVGDQSGPFLGSDVVYQSDADTSAGEIDIGVSRKRGDGAVSGNGVVARVQFKVDGMASDGTRLSFDLSDVSATNPDGGTVLLEVQSLEAEVVIPEIAFADGREGESYEPPSPSPGTADNPLGRVRLSASRTGATLNALTVENAGSSLQGVTTVELWRSADATFEAQSDTQIAEDEDSTATPASFDGVGASIPTDSTYLFVVSDLGPGAKGDYSPVIRSEEALTIKGGALRTINGQSDSTFADAYLSTSATPLPVELTNFKAKTSDEGAVLTWSTASERNNAGFAVQHRADSTAHWQKLDFVDSKAEGGTTTDPQKYQYRTADLEIGTHQFRLRQVDTDGATHLSEPIQVTVAMDESYRLTSFPNPAARQATIKVAVKEKQEVRLTLYDVLGREVAKLHEGPFPAQETKTLTLDVRRQDLSSGSYFLRIVGEEFVGTRRLMIVR